MPFWRTGSERWVSIFGKDTTTLDDTISGTRAVYGWPVEVGGEELKLVAMTGAHGAVTRSHVAAAVTVKWMVDIDSRTYGEDQMREREWRCMGCGWPC